MAEIGPCIPRKRRECIPAVVEERRQEFLFLARASYIHTYARRTANLERNKKKSRRVIRGRKVRVEQKTEKSKEEGTPF